MFTTKSTKIHEEESSTDEKDETDIVLIRII